MQNIVKPGKSGALGDGGIPSSSEDSAGAVSPRKPVDTSKRWPRWVRMMILVGGALLSWGLVYAAARVLM